MANAAAALHRSNPVDLAAVADQFAEHAHGSIGQRRRYTGRPYIEHPREVAQLVRDVGGSEILIAAAVLHDILDVPWVSPDLISHRFGGDVAHHVLALSPKSRPSDGNREQRQAVEIMHLAGADDDTQTIKLADVISNAKDIVEKDPVFSAVYLPEKQRLLRVMRGGHPSLRARAVQIVDSGLAALEEAGQLRRRSLGN